MKITLYELRQRIETFQRVIESSDLVMDFDNNWADINPELRYQIDNGQVPQAKIYPDREGAAALPIKGDYDRMRRFWYPLMRKYARLQQSKELKLYPDNFIVNAWLSQPDMKSLVAEMEAVSISQRPQSEISLSLKSMNISPDSQSGEIPHSLLASSTWWPINSRVPVNIEQSPNPIPAVNKGFSPPIARFGLIPTQLEINDFELVDDRFISKPNELDNTTALLWDRIMDDKFTDFTYSSIGTGKMTITSSKRDIIYDKSNYWNPSYANLPFVRLADPIRVKIWRWRLNDVKFLVYDLKSKIDMFDNGLMGGVFILFQPDYYYKTHYYASEGNNPEHRIFPVYPGIETNKENQYVIDEFEVKFYNLYTYLEVLRAAGSNHSLLGLDAQYPLRRGAPLQAPPPKRIRQKATKQKEKGRAYTGMQNRVNKQNTGGKRCKTCKAPIPSKFVYCLDCIKAYKRRQNK